MPVQNIDHYLLQVADMAATRDWYVRVIGLAEGPNPDFRFPVCWLYADGKDVLHIAEGGANVSENRRRYLGQQSTDTEGSGVIDHVAFRATGLQETIERLDREGADYTKRRVDDQASFQLFIQAGLWPMYADSVHDFYLCSTKSLVCKYHLRIYNGVQLD